MSRSADNGALSPERPYRETPDVAAATARLVRSLGKRVATEDPAGLNELVRLDQALRYAWTVAVAVAVAGLRGLGFTDGQIGEELGITKQAVAQRWPR